MPDTKPVQFRLSDETLAELDKLQKALGLSSRAEVVRYAIRRLAADELPAKRKPGRTKR